MVWWIRSRISCPTASSRARSMSPMSKPRRGGCSTPPSAFITRPIPRNGAIRRRPRGSTPCWRYCSRASKRRVSTNSPSLPTHESPHRVAPSLIPPFPDCGPAPAHVLISINSGTSLADKIAAEETVLLAVFTDIHANRQAFSACLDFARARGAERMICLGDYVGYGADPEWTVETVMDLVERGAIAVRGNHDSAIAMTTESMNAEAQAAIEWTRGRLSAPQRRFLADLPLALQEDDSLYVHSEASNPARWRYVQTASDAARSIAATEAQITFCGHIHCPSLYSMSSLAKIASFVPTSGVPVRLLPGRRWLAVLGSVGQPRDGDPAASFARFDTASREITYCAVPYAVEAAARRIRANGPPLLLGDRPSGGR